MIIKFQQFLSPIKLNLFLEVINKTNDGYHNLEFDVFCKNDLIKIKKSNKFSFFIDGPFWKKSINKIKYYSLREEVCLLENFNDKI